MLVPCGAPGAKSSGFDESFDIKNTKSELNFEKGN
jgi:hypothetical protein